MQNISRRNLFTLGAGASVAALGVGGCALFQENPNGSYGLSAAVIAFIQNAVSIANQYIPSIESIAAVAASLFGAAYVSAVQFGTAALNQVIAYLQNIVTNPPVIGAAKLRSVYARLGVPLPSGVLVGYTKNGIPVFAQ
jgi:hypothetical protein